MAATNYSPIQLYYSTTASAAPAAGNLVSGELAINITDGKLYYKDNAGTVQLLSTSTTANGTANGVLYLNGSKVATSGSALTFDGTNLGVGTASPSGKFHAQATNSGIYFDLTTAYTPKIIASGALSDLQIEAPGNGGVLVNKINGAASTFQWYNGASELMRLNNTGLGIGTSSPGAKLEVAGTVASGVVAGYITNTDTSGFSILGLRNTGASGRNYQIGVGGNTSGQNGNFYIYDATAPAVRLTLDSSGNLGLGVTPSAVSTYDRVLQVRNFLFDDNTNGYGILRYNNCYNGVNDIYLSTGAASAFQMAGNAFKWYQAPSGTAGNTITFTQAMTLDASGNLLVGITSGSYKFMVGDGTRNMTINPNSSLDAIFLGTTTAKPLVFGTDNTERARIDSDGNLLVNLTSASGRSGKLDINGIPDNYVGIDILQNASTSQAHIYFRNSNGLVGSISTSGSLTSYNVTSDQRLKENIVDADSASALIDSLQVRKFDWKSDGNHQRYGFVAQELVTVAPEAVHQPADPEEMMAVDYSKLVPMLVKEIQSLRKRLADAGIA